MRGRPMIRFLVLAFTVFGLTVAPLSAAAQSATPRINPLTGKPYSAASQAEFERQQRESEEQSRMADEAAAEDNRLFQEMRARNAEQIRQFDEAIEDWSETHTSPPGTTETFVSTSYDNDTALGERAEITFYNKWDVPTHKIEFGPDGKPTGPVTQTQQGKVWETIGPRIPPGGGVETSYGEDFDGNRIITSARIYGENGKILGDYQFNFDGVPWRGETRDPETGLRNGGFQDERLKPPRAKPRRPLAHALSGATDHGRLRALSGPDERAQRSGASDQHHRHRDEVAVGAAPEGLPAGAEADPHAL